MYKRFLYYRTALYNMTRKIPQLLECIFRAYILPLNGGTLNDNYEFRGISIDPTLGVCTLPDVADDQPGKKCSRELFVFDGAYVASRLVVFPYEP